MERVNNTIRDREKVMRHIKSPKSPIFKMYPIFYNYLRKHQSLDLTPAQAAGTGFDLGKNKLLGLIEKAYECKNTDVNEKKDLEKIDSYFESTELLETELPSVEVPNSTWNSVQVYQKPDPASFLDDAFVDSAIGENKRSRQIKKGWKDKGWL